MIDEKDKGGRPTKLTRDVHDKIIAALKAGNNIDVAAAYAGISVRTLHRWMTWGDQGHIPYLEFVGDVEQAMAQCEVVNVHRLYKAGEVDWRAAAHFLERAFPERWGRRDRMKLEGTVGVRPEAAYDLSKLTDEELAALELLNQARERLSLTPQTPKADDEDEE